MTVGDPERGQEQKANREIVILFCTLKMNLGRKKLTAQEKSQEDSKQFHIVFFWVEAWRQKKAVGDIASFLRLPSGEGEGGRPYKPRSGFETRVSRYIAAKLPRLWDKRGGRRRERESFWTLQPVFFADKHGGCHGAREDCVYVRVSLGL